MKNISIRISKRTQLALVVIAELTIAICRLGGASLVLQGMCTLLVFLLSSFFLCSLIPKKQPKSIKFFISICLLILLFYVIGLASDGVGLLLKIGKPLDSPIVPIFFYLSQILLITFWSRTAQDGRFSIGLKLRRPSFRGSLVSLFSLLIPLFVLTGVTELNNGGPAILSLAAYVLIAVLTILLILRKSKLDERYHISILLIIAVSLLLSSALRSHFLSGADINREFQLSSFIQSKGFWDINLYRNPYNACLSITLLPVAISNLTHVSLLWIHKLLIPLIFSLIVIPVYFIANGVLENKKASFVVTVFFMSQPAFFTTYLLPVRQEVALLFFAGGLLSLLCFQKNARIGKVIFILMNFGMIVSHYSTAYMAIAFYVLIFIGSRVKRPEKGILISGKLMTTLLIATFLWYSQLTVGFGSVVGFLNKSIDSIPSLLNADTQQAGQSVTNQLEPFGGTNEIEKTYKTYINNNSSNKSGLSPVQVSIPTKSLKLSTPKLADIFTKLRGLAKDIGELLIVMGGITLLVRAMRSHKVSFEELMSISGLVLLIVVVLLPFVSINYDFNRAYQQLLIVVCPLLAVVAQRLKLLSKYSLVGLGLFVALYLLFLSRTYTVAVGGTNTTLIFSNGGLEFDSFYAHKSDVEAADWLLSRASNSAIIADTYADLKIALAHPSDPNKIINHNLFQGQKGTDSYTFSDYTNDLYGITIVSYEGTQLVFRFPADYLNHNANTVYVNTSARVYSTGDIGK